MSSEADRLFELHNMDTEPGLWWVNWGFIPGRNIFLIILGVNYI